ncbi:MAG: glycosyl hydrolase family 18 protein [Bacillota bacterium]
MKRKILYILLLTAAIIFAAMYLLNNFYFLSKAANVYHQVPRLIVLTSDEVIDYGDDMKTVEIIGEHGEIYVLLDILRDGLGVWTDYDEENRMAVITTKNDVIRFYGLENAVKLNTTLIKDISPMIYVEDKPFIPISQLTERLGIESQWIQENNTVVLKSLYGNRTAAKAVKSDVRARMEESIWSEVIDIISSGETLEILEEAEKWTKILTESGQIAYVPSKTIGEIEKIEGVKQQDDSPVWMPETEKILLTWEHVHSRNPDTSQIGEMKGLNVISPTWMSLTDASGTVKHKISTDYIGWAKNEEYKIWPLFNNSFDPDLTHQFLQDAAAREKAINRVLTLVKQYNMDGINIDFENVYLKDKERLVQFVRELVPVFHEKGLTVSIDVTVKSMTENWSLCYDRAALGEVVDYMAVMTYDEHWSSSPISGSVASIGWVENGLQGILEEVPPEKILLGIPFYTRIWTETPSQAEAGAVDVKSKAAGMQTINDLLKEQKIEKIWDEAAGQYYASYTKDGKTHKIWIEDAKSIELKAKLIEKYNLAGAASWRRGFETPDIWDVLEPMMNTR